MIQQARPVQEQEKGVTGFYSQGRKDQDQPYWISHLASIHEAGEDPLNIHTLLKPNGVEEHTCMSILLAPDPIRVQ